MKGGARGTIFVTGGNGFIGSRVLRRLLEVGYAVRCLLRKGCDTRRIDHLSFESVTGEIGDRKLLAEAIRGCSGVIHLAGVSGWRNIGSADLRRVVVDGTRSVLQAALESGKPRVVYVSSAAAVNGTSAPRIQDETAAFRLPKGRFPYAESKRSAERICAAFVGRGLPIVIVNPVEVYGPEDWDLITAGTLVQFVERGPVLVCRGGTSVAYVDDVTRGIVAALERGVVGERYILGGENVTLEQLARTTLEILGRESRVIVLPNALTRAAYYLLSPFGNWMGVRSAIPYALRYWFMDPSKAERELGVVGRPLREVLEPTLQWLVDEGFIRGVSPN